MSMRIDAPRIAAPGGNRASELATAVARALRRDRILIAAVAVHMAAAAALAAMLGVPFESGTVPMLITALTKLLPCFLAILVGWRFAVMAVAVRPAHPVRWLIDDLRRLAGEPGRLLGGLAGLACISVLAGTSAFVKDLIPIINPFDWDPAFAALDRALHGGHDPYALLMPVLGNPVATRILDAAYYLWFFLIYFVVIATCFDTRNPVRRATLLLAFVLTWVVGGNALAIAFSSVGPVYYAPLGFGDAFAPLMERLHAINAETPIWAVKVHAMLLDGYLNDGPVKGISAMPSMHVACAALLAFHGFTVRRWIGWALAGFLVVIQVGSVHLAWHYAIDGYFGIVIAGACWLAARAVARRVA
ncbi:phosphatase PAP2 family protein [Roseovarius salinarum]|uniref:phosphatase PAP2 family protein n=1 Tax=Roseovarius salinarum TaxID=1981892 RepID=UPI001E50F569|nr:phosphatase PAP2 family protein [Roseovarius salinarum]